MVSFSCDACQNVFTKPKVERHFHSCRTRSVSCIDCGVVFSANTVRGHKSCITEEQKFGPKAPGACTQTYCGLCSLQLNGAVHAAQHYDSKKHRAALRKKGASEKKTRKAEQSMLMRSQEQKAAVELTEAETRAASGEERAGEIDGRGRTVKRDSHSKKVSGLKRVIKKALLRAPKQRLKRKRLLRAVAGLLGDKAPSNLEDLVDRKVRRSKRFTLRKDRIVLAVESDIR